MTVFSYRMYHIHCAYYVSWVPKKTIAISLASKGKSSLFDLETNMIDIQMQLTTIICKIYWSCSLISACLCMSLPLCVGVYPTWQMKGLLLLVVAAVALISLITTTHGRKYYGLLNYGCVFYILSGSVHEFMITLASTMISGCLVHSTLFYCISRNKQIVPLVDQLCNSNLYIQACIKPEYQRQSGKTTPCSWQTLVASWISLHKLCNWVHCMSLYVWKGVRPEIWKCAH